MSTFTMVRGRIGCGAAGVSLLMLVLAGCATTTPDTVKTAETAPATSTQFVACLKAAGVEAKVSDQGYVLVKIASQTGGSMSSSSDDGGEAPLLMVGDNDGSAWVAAQSSAYFAADPDTQDAYARCEAESPGFAQPEYSPEKDSKVQDQRQQQAASALEFARCARDEGFSWVADPDPQRGAIVLPATLTEADFRALLTACWGVVRGGLAWAIPSGELGFDWRAVLDEFTGRDTSGGSSSLGRGE